MRDAHHRALQRSTGETASALVEAITVATLVVLPLAQCVLVAGDDGANAGGLYTLGEALFAPFLRGFEVVEEELVGELVLDVSGRPVVLSSAELIYRAALV
jgi:hypothetical protein